MSDQGLSIFDHGQAKGGQAAPTRGPNGAPLTLPIARRGGYDKDAVDAVLAQQGAQLQAMYDDLQAAQAQTAELAASLESAQGQLDEVKVPSYAGLGGRASAMLRLAEEEASEIRSTAEREAHEIREHANRDAKAIRLETQADLATIRSAQVAEIADQRDRLITEAQNELTLARAEAEDIVAAARRDAEQLRLAAEQEVTELRTQVQREVEQARAGADREVQEARRMLAVEKERLAREATDFHSSKLAETRALVEDAQTRAAAAEDRARAANAQVTELRQRGQQDSERMVSRAKAEAEALIAAARNQAESVSLAGTAEAQRELLAATAEVNRMQKRRDAIAAQLASLGDLVSGFARDQDPAEAAEAVAADPQTAKIKIANKDVAAKPASKETTE